MSNINDASYWDERYQNSDTPWNIQAPSPALVAYFDQLKDKNISILIPGAGHAHEAMYLAEQGFTDVTVCDISEKAISDLREKLKNDHNIHLIQGDFFQLEDKYDLIIEQTFFCALDPLLRKEYVRKMNELLKPGGKIAGLLFDTVFAHSGPPFGGSKAEYTALFKDKFHIHTMAPCYNSIPQRAGNELFFICNKISL